MSQKEEVQEKVAFEYERFYLSFLCQSKAAIYERSAEIELRKEVNRELQKLAPEREEVYAQLLAADSILDEACRYVQDHRAGEPSAAKLVGRWLSSLSGVPYHAMRRGS